MKLIDFITEIGIKHRQLLAIFGALKEVVLPNDADIERKVGEIFTNIGVELIEIPFSFESAKSSFLKTIKIQPPNSPNCQQFKDGVIWADCCRLLDEDNVFLVTEDKAFYDDKKYSKGLVANLKDEASERKHSLSIFPSLSELLNDLRVDVPLDTDKLISSFFQQYREIINEIQKRNGFQLGDLDKVSKELYITENTNELFLEFTISFNCVDVTGENRFHGKLLLDGKGIYSLNEEAFSNLIISGEKLSYQQENGEERVVQNYVFLAGSAILGHREVKHIIRYQLDQ